MLYHVAATKWKWTRQNSASQSQMCCRSEGFFNQGFRHSIKKSDWVCENENSQVGEKSHRLDPQTVWTRNPCLYLHTGVTLFNISHVNERSGRAWGRNLEVFACDWMISPAPLRPSTPTLTVCLQRERWAVIYSVPWDTLSITSVSGVFTAAAARWALRTYTRRRLPVVAFKGKSRGDACVCVCVCCLK